MRTAKKHLFSIFAAAAAAAGASAFGGRRGGNGGREAPAAAAAAAKIENKGFLAVRMDLPKTFLKGF